MRGAKSATKKLQAPIKKAKAAVKKAQPVKRVSQRSGSGGKSGGWLGGSGGAQNLDKWYGVFRARTTNNTANPISFSPMGLLYGVAWLQHDAADGVQRASPRSVVSCPLPVPASVAVPATFIEISQLSKC
jgi:hypothetical protein